MKLILPHPHFFLRTGTSGYRKRNGCIQAKENDKNGKKLKYLSDKTGMHAHLGSETESKGRRLGALLLLY